MNLNIKKRITSFILSSTSKNVHTNIFKKYQFGLFEFNYKFTGYEYVTNLPLQMIFYFHCFYTPFWFFGCLISLIYKVILVYIYLFNYLLL